MRRKLHLKPTPEDLSVDSYALDFYEKIYYYELERREKTTNKLTISFAIIIAVIGFIPYLIDKKPTLSSWPMFYFWFNMLISTIAISLSIFFYFRAWQGYYGAAIPSLRTLEDWRKSCLSDFKFDRNRGSKTRKELKKAILDYYIDTATHNAASTELRHESIYNSTLSIAAAVFLLTINYFIIFFSDPNW